MKKLFMILALICLCGCGQVQPSVQLNINNDYMSYEDKQIHFHFEVEDYDQQQYRLKVVMPDFNYEQEISELVFDHNFGLAGSEMIPYYKILSNPYGTVIRYELYDYNDLKKPIIREMKEYAITISDQQLTMMEKELIINHILIHDIQINQYKIQFHIECNWGNEILLFDNENIGLKLQFLNDGVLIHEEMMDVAKNGFAYLKEIMINANDIDEIVISDQDHQYQKVFVVK